MEDRICYSYDATKQRYLPDVVIRPKTAEEISRIIKVANRERIPVVPRGAGTGFVGGSLAVEGGISLVLTRMNRIVEIDTKNFIAMVEPGVVTYRLQEEVGRLGLFYPPDPASLKISTLGGNAAMCSGGPRGVKYGVTKDYVLGLEVVLPTGEILNTGVRTMKGVVGYDLTKLIIGSEGTLGVITRITLKLIPLPESIRTLLAVFPQIDNASATVIDIIGCRIIPSTLEFMDQTTVRCVEDFLKMGLPTEAEALLLIEVDGDKVVADRDIDRVAAICHKGGASEIRIAGDEKDKEYLWTARRAISPALGRLNKIKINEDITVPRSKVPDIIRKVRDIGKRYNLTIANFGHAGDGNIHVNIMISKDDSDEMERAEKVVKEIFRATLELGGTLSGEHGVGITKRPFIGEEIEPAGIEVMRRIKGVLDPNNIMNPGKIIPKS
ncbi:MAG: FAD-binding oxidoreductase [Nitrospinota bacterium]